MSSRIFQSVIGQLKDATDRAIGLIDAEGTVVASSDPALLGEKWTQEALTVAAATENLVTTGDKTFKPLASWSAQFESAVFAMGSDSLAATVCMMAHVALSNAKTHYEERYDKATFVKNVITDNIMPGDIYVRAKELHFATNVPRAVFLVRQTGRIDASAMDVLQNLFSDKQMDFVISINETDVAVVRQVDQDTDSAELVKTAKAIEETLNSEIFVKTVIGVGTVAGHLRELADSYKEAQLAIEVGKVFDTERSVITYENLGIGRLIYQLPTTLCEIFLAEVFKKNSIDTLDQETLYTINKFFENNLNVSETSRKLFVHRNTLVYRLEKIKKLTGLDLREFDHAIIFKVALMVKKYLNSRETGTAAR